LPTVSVGKSIGNNIFLLSMDLPTKKNYRRNISVGDFIGKLITNEMIVQIPTEKSVGKYKDSGSD